MRRRIAAMLACVFAAVLLALPTVALALDFTPDARLDDDGVLNWDAEGEYYSRIDLSPLTFGPNSADSSKPPVNGEYTYDIENLFQAAEQFYPIAGSIDGLNGSHPVTFVYYEKQSDGTMKEVGRAEDAYSYSYTTGQLVKLATPTNLSWTGDDGFTASWDSVEYAGEYRVNFYETVSGSTSEVGGTYVEGTTCELTSVVTTPKDGATYVFDVRAWGPEENYEYRASDTSAKSAESVAWKTPVVEYGLFVGGIEVTSENATDVLGDGTVSYDPNAQTLTLDGANILGTNQGGRAIETDLSKQIDLTILLVGANATGPIMTHEGCPLTITGSGSLTVTQPNSGNGETGISTQNEIVIDRAKVIVNSKESGITANIGAVTIQNGAQVEVSCTGGNAYGAIISTDLTVTGEDTSLDASSEGWSSWYTIDTSGDTSIKDGASVDVTGRVHAGGNFEVSGINSLITASIDSTSCVIECTGTVSAAEGATIDVDGRVFGGAGISVTGGGTLDVDMREYNHYAVESNGPVTVTDSTLTAKSPNIVVFCENQGAGTFTATNSTINLSSQTSYALFAYQDIDVTGGSLTLSASASCGACTYKDLSVTGGTVLDLKGQEGFWATNVTIDDATGTAFVNNAAVYGSGAVMLKNCDDLNLDGDLTVNAEGALTIESSSLEVTGSDAIYSADDVTITNSQIKVDATKRPIAGDSVTISGDTTDINATGGWYIGASDELIISGGKVTVDVTTDPNENVMGALYGNNAVRISGGAVDATVSKSDDADITYALMTNGVAEFTGGTITLEGGAGAIYVSKNGGSVGFGTENPTWYQWATSPAGAVKPAANEPYSYSGDTSTYLRFEPAGTTYRLTVNGGQGGGSYAAGTQAVITAEAANADGHFAGWSVTEDPTDAGTLADAEAASTTFTMPAANVTLTASYEAHTFSNGACTVCGEKDSGYVPPTPPHNPPASSGPDWDDVTSDISNAESGDRVVVDMEGETELPGEVLEALAGSDVTLVLEMGDGVAWEIAGAGVPEDTSFSATDLGVSMGTSGIPVDVTNLVTGEHGTVQVTLSHEGDFGFELALVAPLGEKNEGLYANLYHYDDAEELLRFGSFGVVGEDGTVRLALTRASQLAIAIDVRSHELPFSDAGEGKWYSEPVRWAWLSGAMTGYGDGSSAFGPADALSRAQLAVVLWRLAGEPEGSAGLPADCGEGEFYSGAVSWALGAGVFSGYESGSFGPADALTREQAATVLWRAAGSPEAGCDLYAYPDAGGVSEFASAAMRWAVSEGVLRGREPEPGALVLDPQGTCSRAELAALMMRLSAE